MRYKDRNTVRKRPIMHVQYLNDISMQYVASIAFLCCARYLCLKACGLWLLIATDISIQFAYLLQSISVITLVESSKTITV